MRTAPALRHAGVVFIRRTATRARRDGGSYTSFRLVESVRDRCRCQRTPRLRAHLPRDPLHRPQRNTELLRDTLLGHLGS